MTAALMHITNVSLSKRVVFVREPPPHLHGSLMLDLEEGRITGTASPCRHCRRGLFEHAANKCLLEPTAYDPRRSTKRDLVNAELPPGEIVARARLILSAHDAQVVANLAADDTVASP